MCTPDKICFLAGRAILGIYVGMSLMITQRVLVECIPGTFRGFAMAFAASFKAIALFFTSIAGLVFGKALL